MALSNYASFAFTHDGEPTNAQFKTENYVIRPYKAKIQIKDREKWESDDYDRGDAQILSVRSAINEGLDRDPTGVTIDGHYITVKKHRNLNNGIICSVHKLEYDEEDNIEREGIVMGDVYAPEPDADIKRVDIEETNKFLKKVFGHEGVEGVKPYSQSFLGSQGSGKELQEVDVVIKGKEEK